MEHSHDDGAGPGCPIVVCRLLAACVLVGLLAGTGEARAAPEPCSADTPWDSLCNVEPDLRPSYRWLERVAGLTHFRERISGMVRNRHVTVEWNWSLTDQELLGGFVSATHQVLLPSHLRGGPDRVEAAIIAHELWHAYSALNGRYHLRTLIGCVRDEREAFMVGLRFYDHLRSLTGEPPRSMSRADAYFQDLLRDWEDRGGSEDALATVADDYVRRGGYALRCLPELEPEM